MRGFSLAGADGPLERLLVIGCHADDAEIGCGGTITTLLAAHPALEVTWLVLTAAREREAEARQSAEAMLATAGAADIRIHGFRDGYLPYDGAAVKDVFEGLKELRPDLVLTHTRHDLHQDHRLACELTWNTFRDAVVLEYEIPKYDGDLGVPNVFVPLTEETVDAKIEHLDRFFATQRHKDWFDPDLFRSLMRLRGMECRSPSGYAEAFHGRKVRWDV